jgi:DNA-directed RNA polymerase specialized sigma24 family protein
VRPPPFQAFLDQHREDVYRFLVYLVGPGEADDCFQETFLAALRAYPRLRDESNLKAWVMTIAHRKGLDAHRSRRRRPEPVGAVPEAAAGLALDGEGPGDPALWQAVGGLPPKQRAAVVHRFVADLPYREIARVMGTTEEAARRSVHEGVRKLREVWKT